MKSIEQLEAELECIDELYETGRQRIEILHKQIKEIRKKKQLGWNFK